MASCSAHLSEALIHLHIALPPHLAELDADLGESLRDDSDEHVLQAAPSASCYTVSLQYTFTSQARKNISVTK